MTIRVSLIKRAGRKFYEAQWRDPVTQLKKTRSTEETTHRNAERFAARLEDELNSGATIDPALTVWSNLIERYKKEVLSTLAQSTRNKTIGTFNKFNELINPKMASAITSSVISKFASALRKEELSEFTVKGHLSELRKVLRWAARMGLIRNVPNIEMPRRLTAMKGRPITGEEYDRMKAAVFKVVPAPGSGGGRKKDPSKIVPAHSQDSWIELLDGLWLSGLRLNEAMKLHWTDDTKIMVDLSGRRPMMRIQAGADKGRKFRLLPITKEFAEFLEKTPVAERRGFVFNPCPLRPPFELRLLDDWVSKVISRIGAKAGVKVSDTKAASAHDFRRAFGFRWSRLVMPPILQELMRHESIATTMQYYVGRNAEATADSIWAAAEHAAGNTSGNTGHSEAAQPSGESVESA